MSLTESTALTIAGDSVNDTHINWGVGTNQVSAVDVPIADGGDIISATDVEAALQEHRTAINLNTAKNTNVSTTLSVGTNTTTELSITSDGGADDVTLPLASTSLTGVFNSATFDDITANTTFRESAQEIDTAVHMLADTLSAVFLLGANNDADSATFQVGAITGAWKQRQDSLIPRILDLFILGESGDSITVAIYHNTGGIISAGKTTVLSTTGVGVDGGAVTVTSFDDLIIEKNEYIWMEVVEIAGTRPKYFVGDLGYSEKRDQ